MEADYLNISKIEIEKRNLYIFPSHSCLILRPKILGVIRMVDDKDIMKTGTTTVAMKCKDGIVLCADKRVTAGYLIANKKFTKILSVTDSMAVTVAGTVSDVQLLVKILKAEIRLRDVRTGRKTTVHEATNLLAGLVYGNIRKYSLIPGISHFVIAGADKKGLHIYDIGADGSITEVDDYVSSGSGSVMAFGVLEALYVPNLSVKEGVELGKKSINAAVQRDIASGNGIDIVAITAEGVQRVETQLVSSMIK